MPDAPATERPAVHDPPAADATRSAVRGLARLARMVERSCPDLSLSQYRVLARVATGDQRASLLAGRLALSKPSVTAAVDGLVERGYLIRSGVEADRRAVQLDLTPAGHKALEAADDAMVAQLQRLLGQCEDPGLALAGLCELARALDVLVAARMAKAGE
jgi:DNA-binding MarR family transcriptional regulator